MPLDNVVFWVFAPISIGSAIGMLFQRNAVHAVLFLFVIMLLGVDREETLIEQLRGQRPLAIVLGLGIAVELFFAIRAGVGFATRGPENFDEVANRGLVGNAEALSRVLFRNYFFPFEVTSILLIIAAIAVMVLASRRARAITRAEQAAAVDRRGTGPAARGGR